MTWSKLPAAQRTRLVALLSQLVEERLHAAGPAEESAHEQLPLASALCGAGATERQGAGHAFAAPGGCLRAPIDTAAGRAPSRIDAAPICPDRTGR